MILGESMCAPRRHVGVGDCAAGRCDFWHLCVATIKSMSEVSVWRCDGKARGQRLRLVVGVVAAAALGLAVLAPAAVSAQEDGGDPDFSDGWVLRAAYLQLLASSKGSVGGHRFGEAFNPWKVTRATPTFRAEC